MHLLLIPLWILLYELIPVSNQNIKRNIFSAIHSVISVYMSYNNEYTIIFYLSSSYYIYDMIMQFLSPAKLLSASTMTLTVHHVIAIYTLEYLNSTNEQLINLFMYIFMLLEMSNFPVYMMYHWKQITKYKKESAATKIIEKLLLLLEILSFLTLRLIYSLYILVKYFNVFSYDLLAIASMLYILSIFWWINMLYQLKK